MRYTILGERCSGTNYLEHLLIYNFKEKRDWLGGWKHFFGFEGYDQRILNNKDIIYFTIVRNPYDWIMSFWNNPHHQHVDRLTNIETFLFSEFYSMYLVKGIEIFHDRDGNNRRFKNLFEMRRYKLSYMYNRLPELSDNIYHIQFENLINNPKSFLDDVKNKYALSMMHDEYVYPKKSRISPIKDNPSADKIDKEKIYITYKIDNPIKHIIDTNIDWNIENNIGYEKR